ncbi:MAG: FAD-binding oxidoreductase [Balneolaceae bacterium]|nr:FAD-binding oxidoreductase [Balneolaceae bacterium]
MRKPYDACILGAGLAGMHTALELQEAGLSVCVVDPKSIAGGASGTPVGLANPATGRFANRSWEAEQCLTILNSRLEQLSKSTGKEFYRKSGVLRPALSIKIANRMQENVTHNDWLPGMVEWKSSSDIEKMHPGLTCVEGGVWIPVGLTVHIPEYITAMHSYLETKDVDFKTGLDYQLEETEHWKITTNKESFTATKLIVCAGIYSKSLIITKNLPFHAVKGQTAQLRSNSTLNFDHAVSAQGYFSKINSNEFILGSTYEHNFEHEKPDQKGKQYMLKRFRNVQPDLADHSEVISQWAGVRASTPDRKPVIGAIPGYKNAFVFAGLGSKGLLYSAYGARILKEYLLDNAPVPEALSITRF